MWDGVVHCVVSRPVRQYITVSSFSSCENLLIGNIKINVLLEKQTIEDTDYSVSLKLIL